jgi:hypothetical protein
MAENNQIQNPDPRPITISIDPHSGHLISSWWDPATGDLICTLCSDCKGWNSPEKPLDCSAGNPWCG